MRRRFTSLVAATMLAAAPLALSAQGPPATPPATPPSSAAKPAADTGEVVDRVIAVVGNRPVLLSEVMEFIYAQRGRGMELPSDSAGFAALQLQVLDKIIDDEVLVNAAKTYKIEVADAEIQPSVEKFMKEIHARFKSDAEFRDALKQSGFGNEQEFRKFRGEQDRRDLLTARALDSLRAHGRMSAPVNVTEADVTEAFEKQKGSFPRRPTSVSFRQLVVPVKASPSARATAIAKADSILLEVQTKGVDFEKVAKRESMDPASKDNGGDLGWNRRGQMVPEFDRVMFAYPAGTIAPYVVETSFGFHIIKVERVQPAEVRARHILITPKRDSADIARAKVVADSALALWKKGTPFDSLVTRYHDNAELRGIPDGVAVDSLPEFYKKAIEGVKSGQWTEPFQIPDPRTDVPKWGILLISDRTEGGEYTKADLRDRIRAQLQQERQGRRMLNELRKQQFVVIMR